MISDFGRLSSSKDGMSFYCLECNKKYRTDRKVRNTTKILEQLGGIWKCQRCDIVSKHGQQFYDWHHVVPSLKKDKISNLIKEVTWKTLKTELDKCILVCPNCHADIHIEEFGKRAGV